MYWGVKVSLQSKVGPIGAKISFYCKLFNLLKILIEDISADLTLRVRDLNMLYVPIHGTVRFIFHDGHSLLSENDISIVWILI